MYGDDWERSLAISNRENAANWEELERGGMLWLRPGQRRHSHDAPFSRPGGRPLLPAHARHDSQVRSRRACISAIATSRSIIRKLPRPAGRTSTSFPPISTRAGTTARSLTSYLDTLHALTGKPMLVSEFYMAAEENRSGNKNTVGGFPGGRHAERARRGARQHAR